MSESRMLLAKLLAGKFKKWRDRRAAAKAASRVANDKMEAIQTKIIKDMISSALPTCKACCTLTLASAETYIEYSVCKECFIVASAAIKKSGRTDITVREIIDAYVVMKELTDEGGK